MNARALPRGKMPKFLRKALKRGVVSLAEAQAWVATLDMQRPTKAVQLPPCLHPTLDRILADLEVQASSKH